MAIGVEGFSLNVVNRGQRRRSMVTRSRRGITVPRFNPDIDPDSSSTMDQVQRESSHCVHCGANIGVYRVERLHVGEIALNIVFGALLIAIVVSSAYFFNSWLEHEFQHLFEHRWVWHEPLDDWSI
jgi:hypothetical protein